MSRPLAIGVVGLGWVARDYMLPALREEPDARLAAVCSLGARDFDGLPPAVARYRDLGAMLAAERLDGVYVATPNHLHVAHATACLEAGVGVLCEKLIAPTAAEAERLVAAAERTGVAYATAFDQRHHPAHVRAAELVRGGALGTLTQVRIDYACWVPSDWSPTAARGGAPAPDNWRVDRARAGGGAVIDLAPHGLDLAEAITGQRLIHLAGVLQRVAHDYDVDDGGAFAGLLDGGAVLAHTVGYNRPERLPRRRLELVGTAGALVAVDTMGQTAGGSLAVTPAATGRPEPIAFDAATGPFAGQLRAFARLLRGGGDATGFGERRTPRDDLRLARLLEGAVRAAPAPVHP